MGTNTMVAAVGLVIGPVLGGALVAISWHVGLLVQRAVRPRSAALWACLVLHEVSGRDDERGLDLLGTTTFVVGLTGLVLALSKGGLTRLERPARDRRLRRRGRAAARSSSLIERHGRAPMLDLALFRDRLFGAASAAAFINGLSRFALMFLFVFYFQGPQGQSPIMAGLELAPIAIGMLVASPLAGVVADRHGSRGLAALGMLVSAVGLAGMTMLQAHTAYVWSALWLALVGIGSGMFNSPNTAAMMGVVPVHRRGIAAGARVMLQNTGAVISIAFVMAIVTAAVPKDVLFKIFSGLTSGLSTAQLEPFISNMHLALWVLAARLAPRRGRLDAAARARARTSSVDELREVAA